MTTNNVVEDVVEEVQETKAMGVKDMLKLISNALSIGNITGSQAKEMRAKMGVFQGDFTRKKSTTTKRKAKRTAQKRARRAMHQHGFKGQKMV